MKPNPPSELFETIWRMRPVYGRVVFFAVVASLLSLVPSLYMLEVYERVLNSQSLSTLFMLTMLAVGAYGAMEMLEWASIQVMRVAGYRFEAGLSERVFGAVFQLNLLRGGGTGQQALTDLRQLRDFFVSPVLRAMLESPVALVVLAILFFMHPLLGWFAVFGACIQFVIAYLTERRTHPPMAEANKAATAAQVYAGNTLRNAQVIESMGMLESVHRRWARYQNSFLQQQGQASDHAGGLSAFARAVQLIQSSALLGVGCWLVLQGELSGSGGMMIMGSILGGKVLQPIVQLVSNWKSLIEAREAYARLNELLQSVPPPPGRMSLPAPQGMLSVEAVTAGAPGSPVPILRNVSFALPAGECLAVVGPSASGKTTLARLLMGLWPAMAGKVRLDGADVFAWNKNELGPHVGYLPQGVELFDGTLAENIARFGDVDRAAVETAGRLAGLDALVAELSQGYDSRIGDEGAFLSGGQRQRVGLARAVYGNPRFVVLDEPNSSLDESGEAALLQLLRQLKARGATVVVVTHRTSVLAVVDRMLVMVNGSVQVYGPRDEVLAALAKGREAQVAQGGQRSGLSAPVPGSV